MPLKKHTYQSLSQNSLQNHRESLQLQTHNDWIERECVQQITTAIKRITNFLNTFHTSTSSRLSKLNEKLNKMEKTLNVLECKVDLFAETKGKENN